MKSSLSLVVSCEHCGGVLREVGGESLAERDVGVQLLERPKGSSWSQLYQNGSSRKIDTPRLFSREYDFPKTFSLTENHFSGKTYFYTIHPRRPLVVPLHLGKLLARDLVLQDEAGHGPVPLLVPRVPQDEYQVEPGICGSHAVKKATKHIFVAQVQGGAGGRLLGLG